MTDLSALIARVEEGTYADRDLEIEIARELGLVERDRRPLPWLHCYTESLDSVLSLIEQKLPGWRWSVESAGGGKFEGCLFASPTGQPLKSGSSQIPSRALLAATLRAIQSKERPSHDA